MSIRRIIILTALLAAILATHALAANPWIAVTYPAPYKVWDSQTASMVPNTEPLTEWQAEREHVVVWDFVSVTGNVQIDLLKDGKAFKTLSPAGGTPIGVEGKGFLEVRMLPEWAGNAKYQLRVSSLSMPDILSTSEPFAIIPKQ